MANGKLMVHGHQFTGNGSQAMIARFNADGGSGSDRINGNCGNDQLRGEGGADRIYGGAGNDNPYGGGGLADSADADAREVPDGVEARN